MELRFVAANADMPGRRHAAHLRAGRHLPARPAGGAREPTVDRRTQIGLRPDRRSSRRRRPYNVRHVLVLDPVGTQLPPRPTAADPQTRGKEAAASSRPPGPGPGGQRGGQVEADHAARGRPAAAAGQPVVRGDLAAAGAGVQPAAAGPPARRCPTWWRWRWCSGNVHQPRRVGVGAAFVFGLLMDVHQGALLGQHALAYTLLSYFGDHDRTAGCCGSRCRRAGAARAAAVRRRAR